MKCNSKFDRNLVTQPYTALNSPGFYEDYARWWRPLSPTLVQLSVTESSEPLFTWIPESVTFPRNVASLSEAPRQFLLWSHLFQYRVVVSLLWSAFSLPFLQIIKLPSSCTARYAFSSLFPRRRHSLDTSGLHQWRPRPLIRTSGVQSLSHGSTCHPAVEKRTIIIPLTKGVAALTPPIQLLHFLFPSTDHSTWWVCQHVSSPDLISGMPKGCDRDTYPERDSAVLSSMIYCSPDCGTKAWTGRSIWKQWQKKAEKITR